MAIELSGINFFIPIFSFLLVFLIVYALLLKTKILGESKAIHFMISFILASFFIANVSLTEFVNFSSAWFAVFLICFFFIILFISFSHGDLSMIMKPWVAWILIGLLIGFFILSSAYVFNWAVNWMKVWSWFYTDWFGFVLLAVVAIIVSWVLAKK